MPICIKPHAFYHAYQINHINRMEFVQIALGLVFVQFVAKMIQAQIYVTNVPILMFCFKKLASTSAQLTIR